MNVIHYWSIAVILVAAAAVVGVSVYNFVKQPTEKQLDSVRQWLLYAVTEAEKELGSKTGQLKLSYVYGLFVQRFPAVAAIMPSEQFSGLVDEVLEKFRAMLESNTAVQNYVEPKE